MDRTLVLLHASADAPLARWVADVLERATAPAASVSIDLLPEWQLSRHKHPDTMLRLGWRRAHAQTVHALRAAARVASDEPAELSLSQFRQQLEEFARRPIGVHGRSGNEKSGVHVTGVVLVDDLVADFAPSLSRTISALRLDHVRSSVAPSPLFAEGMTAGALALLDWYAAQASLGDGHEDVPSSGALADVASGLSMEDYQTMVKALTTGRALSPDRAALRATLESLANHSARGATGYSRRDRKVALVQHLVRHWPWRARSTTRGGRSVSSSERSAIGMSARVVASVSSPPCALVRNWASLCRSLVGTPHEAGFEAVADNGCRCPPIGLGRSTTAILVGTHHKTGTVLLEQVLMDATKSVEGAKFHKPRWSECAGAMAATAGRPEAALQARTTTEASRTSASRTTPGAWPSRSPRLAAACVDEHAKSLPSTQSILAHAPVVHVVRDPLEVCVSSYQCVCLMLLDACATPGLLTNEMLAAMRDACALARANDT